MKHSLLKYLQNSVIEQLVTVVHTMTRSTEEQLLDIQLKDVAYMICHMSTQMKEKGVTM